VIRLLKCRAILRRCSAGGEDSLRAIPDQRSAVPIALSLRWPLLAHGFTVETVGRLVLDGLATATAGTV
jgi:hypothetical protein